MTPKRVSIAVGAAAVLAVLAIGLLELPSSTPPPKPAKLTVAQIRSRLAGSPARLAALHAQSGELLAGGLPALRVRLAALRGQAIVINKWASWCEPCRAEVGAFQAAALALGRQVAFIGIDSQDANRGDALAFMRAFPVSYPSYYDESGQAGSAITDSTFTPVTVFYDRNGREYIRQGPYPTSAKLEQDVRRYALDG